ncbi:MAG: DUF1553 domain-containing protein, partial [Planctomycetota bacterium]
MPDVDRLQREWEAAWQAKTDSHADGVGGQLPDEIAAILGIAPEQRNSDQRRELRRHHRSAHSADYQELLRLRQQLADQRDRRIDAAPVVMIMDETPREERRVTRVLRRGTYNQPTEETVEAGVPSVLHAWDDDANGNRLDLARWIMSDDNPLTARVTANRHWQLFFGKGLVTTTEDFGQTGERPTHPALLDWLALKFVENGWDVKRLHRAIVTSATYRQSSSSFASLGDGSTARDVDPNNELYWRSPRFRMSSWMLRDQALAVGGLLNERLGGPPVKPYQPEGVWAEATFGKIKYAPDHGEDLYRRSLYVFWRRIVGPTMFFDAGKRQTCEVKPTRTNTPLHALTTLNEPGFVEAAR